MWFSRCTDPVWELFGSCQWDSARVGWPNGIEWVVSVGRCDAESQDDEEVKAR